MFLSELKGKWSERQVCGALTLKESSNGSNRTISNRRCCMAERSPIYLMLHSHPEQAFIVMRQQGVCLPPAYPFLLNSTKSLHYALCDPPEIVSQFTKWVLTHILRKTVEGTFSKFCPKRLLVFNHTGYLSSVSYWSELALMLKSAYKNKCLPTNVHKQFKNQLYKLLKRDLFAVWKRRTVCKVIFPTIPWCVNICYCLNY